LQKSRVVWVAAKRSGPKEFKSSSGKPDKKGPGKRARKVGLSEEHYRSRED